MNGVNGKSKTTMEKKECSIGIVVKRLNRQSVERVFVMCTFHIIHVATIYRDQPK